MKTTVRKIGNSLGVILSKEVVGPLKLQESDELDVSVSLDGRAIIISPLQTPHTEWEAWFKAHPRAISEGPLMGEDEGLISDKEDWVW
jgi:antitoxin component of MazEF toxin-antitoxin module